MACLFVLCVYVELNRSIKQNCANQNEDYHRMIRTMGEIQFEKGKHDAELHKVNSTAPSNLGPFRHYNPRYIYIYLYIFFKKTHTI